MLNAIFIKGRETGVYDAMFSADRETGLTIRCLIHGHLLLHLNTELKDVYCSDPCLVRLNVRYGRHILAHARTGPHTCTSIRK